MSVYRCMYISSLKCQPYTRFWRARDRTRHSGGGLGRHGAWGWGISAPSSLASRFPTRATSERRGNNLNGSKDFCMKARARIWPGLPYICQWIPRRWAGLGGWGLVTSTETGSYFRLIDSCITQLKAPCTRVKKKKKKVGEESCNQLARTVCHICPTAGCWEGRICLQR